MTEVEWINIFGDNLADMLHDANMTQQELADATGLSKATINAYIHKRKAPGLKAIINIAYVLNCSVDELIDFEEMIE
jgi:transcriptional regulator with XRE-family HTH domain